MGFPASSNYIYITLSHTNLYELKRPLCALARWTYLYSMHDAHMMSTHMHLLGSRRTVTCAEAGTRHRAPLFGERTTYMLGAATVGALATTLHMAVQDQLYRLIQTIVGSHPIAAVDVARDALQNCRRDLRGVTLQSNEPGFTAQLCQAILPWIQWLEGAAQQSYMDMHVEAKAVLWTDFFKIVLGHTALRDSLSASLTDRRFIIFALVYIRQGINLAIQ